MSGNWDPDISKASCSFRYFTDSGESLKMKTTHLSYEVLAFSKEQNFTLVSENSIITLLP